MGNDVGRSTIAKVLKANGIPPSRQRPIAWRTFLQAHWPALLAADFFTTEVWTMRGLVTYYTAFVIELQSRRVHVLGSTPRPDEAFVIQTLRLVTDEADGILRGGRILIYDRDRKWSPAVDRFLASAGVFQADETGVNTNYTADNSTQTLNTVSQREVGTLNGVLNLTYLAPLYGGDAVITAASGDKFSKLTIHINCGAPPPAAVAGAGGSLHLRRVRLLASPVDDANDSSRPDRPQRGTLRARVPAVAPLLPRHSRRFPATGGQRHELSDSLLGLVCRRRVAQP